MSFASEKVTAQQLPYVDKMEKQNITHFKLKTQLLEIN